MPKKNNIVRYTDKQIRAKIARGDSRTSWRKANEMTGAKLDASIEADSDDVTGEPDWTQAVKGIPIPKDHINIRIDHDVLEWFSRKWSWLSDPHKQCTASFCRIAQYTLVVGSQKWRPPPRRQTT